MSDPMNQVAPFEERLAEQLRSYSSHAARRPTPVAISRAVAVGVSVRRRRRWRLFDGQTRLFAFGAVLVALTIGAVVVGNALLDRQTALLQPTPPPPQNEVVSPSEQPGPTPTVGPPSSPRPSAPVATEGAFAPSCFGLWLSQSTELPTAAPRSAGAPANGALATMLYLERGDESRYLGVVDPATGALEYGGQRNFGQSALHRYGAGLERVAWPLDGTLLALDLSGGCYDAFVVSPGSGVVWHVLTSQSNERFVAWGIDPGTWLTESTADGDGRVFVLTLATDSREELGVPCDGCLLTGGPVSWTADGQRFAATAGSRDGGSGRPVVHDANGWRLAPVAGTALGWLPDGSVLVRDGTRLLNWAPDSNQATDLGFELKSASDKFPMALSPDGTELALADRNSSLDVLNLASGERSRVWVDTGLTDTIHETVWSPDGTQLSFVAGLRLWTVGRDGSNPSVSWPAVHGSLAWQPVWP